MPILVGMDGTPPRYPARIAALTVAAMACLTMGFFAFVRHEQVPLLWAADLGVHELGHMLAMSWAPPVVAAAAGSLAQVAVPLGLAAYFAIARKDRTGLSLTLAWAGTSMANVATYIADAPYRQLPLLGGPDGHDWAFIFGPAGFDDLRASEPLSTAVWIVGGSLVAVATGMCLYGIFREVAAQRAATREAARLSALPRHEPRNPAPDDPSRLSP